MEIYSSMEKHKELKPMTITARKSTMTKKKLISLISQEKEIHPNDVRHVIQAFLDKMTECLAEGERVEFRDFGVFEVVKRKQKIGRNPKKAAEPIVIPARKAVKFTPGKKMRKRIDKKDSFRSTEEIGQRELLVH
jgi:integration host factor subunit beta